MLCGVCGLTCECAIYCTFCLQCAVCGVGFDVCCVMCAIMGSFFLVYESLNAALIQCANEMLSNDALINRLVMSADAVCCFINVDVLCGVCCYYAV
jgi:hypothetical protein